MKLFNILNPRFGPVFTRIDNALHKYAPPEIEWVNTEQEADAALIHVVGGEEVLKCRALRKPAIIFQHCYFTAMPVENDFIGLWKKALLTLSFHELNTYTDQPFNFFRTPLGYESDLFFKYGGPRPRTIFATGHVAETECLDKIHQACVRANALFFHTGENFGYNPNYKFLPYLDDAKYRHLLNSVSFVAGLRDIEGFEVACLEGAACGAKPIVPDLPTYSYYKNFAHMIDMKHDVVDQLVNILRHEPLPFTPEQEDEIRSFTWDKIVPKIFQEVLKNKP